jgi:glycosyltransferase involved in cell wall biosynthesis
MQLNNVVILGQRPKEDMPGIWTATDASLILLRRNDAFKKVIPSKMFEAMAMRCPIILGVQGEASELLDEAGAGISIVPEDAEQLAAAVMRLLENPELSRAFGDAAAAFVREHYDRAVLARRYLELLEKTMAINQKGRRGIRAAATAR